MEKPELVMALYKPMEGKAPELEALIKKHFPTLRDYGLTTDRLPFVAKSQNGTYVEIFEWISASAAKKAHDHPGVAKIWEAMAMVCDFEKLQSLPEAANMFPHFTNAW